MICPACSAENLLGSEECEACGTDLSGLIHDPIPTTKIQEHLLLDTTENLFPYRALLVQFGEPVSKAIRLMQENRYGCVMVVRGEELVGIFTERDVLYKIANAETNIETTRIETVMTPNPAVVHPHETLAHALNLMSLHRYRHIPVVDEGITTGFISVKGVFHYLCEKALNEE